MTFQRLRRNWLIIAAVFVALILLSVNAIGNAGRGAAAAAVVLNASGGAAMDVTYSVGDKNSQNTSAASPWQASYQVTGALPFVSMVVQNGGGGSNTVSCSITENGRVVDSNTSYGAYAVVQCSR